jgi:large subunit ribosomal protein L25
MSQTTLVVQTGRDHGSAAARRLRAEDKIPGVLYGRGMSPVPVAVGRRELRHALSGPAGFNTVLELVVDGTKYPAVIKEVQRHPVRRNVSHIDFFQINMSELLTVSVPLRLEGEAKAVMNDGGLVDPAVDTIEVECTPNDMPNEFIVDISDMQPGDVIRLSFLTMPTGVTALGDPDMAIVTALHGFTAAELESDAVPVAEEGEAAEGAEDGSAEAGEAAGESSAE